MSTTVTLLLLAVQLLTVVLQSPNLPPDVRATAIQVANRAITYAQTDQGNVPIRVQIGTTSPIIIQPQQQTPPSGSTGSTQAGTVITQTHMPQPQPQLVVSLAPGFIQGGYKDSANDVPFGEFFFKVSYIKSDGTYVNGMDSDGKIIPEYLVTVDAPDGAYDNNRTFDGVASGKPQDRNNFYHIFSYTPGSIGHKKITFHCNGLSTSIEVDVQ